MIETGFQAEINAALELRAVEATVDVTGDAPIVDTRATRVGVTFSRDVLDRIPTARDPWQIVAMAAGVEVPEFNVGGRRSGVQMSFTSRGQGTGDTMWNVEGATITDMAVPGTSPTYYDFDSFQEIQVTTGAAHYPAGTGLSARRAPSAADGGRRRGGGSPSPRRPRKESRR